MSEYFKAPNNVLHIMFKSSSCCLGFAGSKGERYSETFLAQKKQGCYINPNDRKSESSQGLED